MNGASSAWITARKRLQSFTAYPLLKEPETSHSKAASTSSRASSPGAGIMSQPHCDTSQAPHLGQKPKSKHKMRRIPCSSICSITCRAVRESLTYSDSQFIPSESTLLWHSPSEELHPLCPKKSFGFCDVYHKVPVLQRFTWNPFLRETASRTGDTQFHTRCSSFCSASAGANTHWNCDWHMRQWTIGHWQTLSSEELATSDTTGNV